MTLDNDMIEIVIDTGEIEALPTTPQNVRGGWGQEVRSADSVKQSTTKLNVTDLETKMSGFLQMVSRIFSSAEQEAKKTSGMSLDEIELSVEIGAGGEIRLIGSGTTVSGKGAIKLKFKRQQVS
jgi:hypothetical protein